MTIINATPDRPIQLGYEGEDRVTVLRFRYGKEWLENGEGIFTVRVLRNGEKQAYNAQVIKDDRENLIIDMTVTDIELSKIGYGEMQLVYTGADFVKKSPVYKYYVSRSVDDAVDPPESDIYTQLIESLSDLQTDVQGLSDAVENIGDISLLTTMTKTDLVSAINEVNEHGGGGSVTVDSELSTTSENPVQNKVVTSAIQSKADIQTVSALSDAVSGLDSDIQSLQTEKADASTVTALSGTVSGLQTAVQSKADAQTVTTLSSTVTGLQTDKADKSYVDTQLAEKASTQTVSDLSDDVSDLQTGLASKVGDVQINGVSVVTDGVAEIPQASSDVSGVVKATSQYGTYMSNGQLRIYGATASEVKNGTHAYHSINPFRQHESTFYGFAKAAGDTTQATSSNTVGQYTEEAKSAIHDMLGIGTARELRAYTELGEDMSEIEIPLPERYEKVWFRFQCRINNAENNLPNGQAMLLSWLGDTSNFNHDTMPSVYENVYIRQNDIFMLKVWFVVDFPFVERFATAPYGATNWSAKSAVNSFGGSYVTNRLTSYPMSLYIRPYEINKGYLFKANSMLGVYVK